MGVTILTSASGRQANSRLVFDKADSFSPVFTKTAAGALSIKADTWLAVGNDLVKFRADTAVVMPALNGGIDYAIYVCSDGSVRADSNFTSPTGYTTNNSRLIGGFHHGLVAVGETVAGGLFTTSGDGMIWTQADVDRIAGINQYSIYDAKFRPIAGSAKGMTLANNVWVDIYLCNSDTDANGTSAAGSNMASGTVLPKIPAVFGGDGTATYASLNWWVANELARAHGKRLLLESEFVTAAFGVTENQSIDSTNATYPTTRRNAGFTSKYGVEQASGHIHVWGSNTGTQAAAAFAWASNGGRGQIFNNSNTRVVLGGVRSGGANCGSRTSVWSSLPSTSSWGYGLRAACDHMQFN